MKRCFVYMAAFIMALCIAGCSNGNNKDNAKKENVKTEQPKKAAKKKSKKGFLMPNASGLPYEMLAIFIFFCYLRMVNGIASVVDWQNALASSTTSAK